MKTSTPAIKTCGLLPPFIILKYVENKLSDGRRKEVGAHLRKCKTCSRARRQISEAMTFPEYNPNVKLDKPHRKRKKG